MSRDTTMAQFFWWLICSTQERGHGTDLRLIDFALAPEKLQHVAVDAHIENGFRLRQFDGGPRPIDGHFRFVGILGNSRLDVFFRLSGHAFPVAPVFAARLHRA